MIKYTILSLTILLFTISNCSLAQELFEQKFDGDSTTSAWHYHSIFTVSRDSIYQLLVNKVSTRLIRKIKASTIYITVNIDDMGKGDVKVANTIKYIGKKCAEMMAANLQATPVWIPAYNIDKESGRKFHSSSLLPLIIEYEDLLKAAEIRDLRELNIKRNNN